MCHVGEESRLSTEEEEVEEEEEEEDAGRTCRIGITARYSQRRFGCWVFRAFGGGDEREEIVEVKLRASLT